MSPHVKTQQSNEHRTPRPLGARNAIRAANAGLLGSRQEKGIDMGVTGCERRGLWSAAAGLIMAAIMTGVTVPLLAQAPSAPANLRKVSTNESLPVLTVTVSPASVTLAPGETAQFAAVATLATAGPPAWKATGGTVSATGLFKAGTTPGTYEVIATRSGVSGRATVTVKEVAPPPTPTPPPPTPAPTPTPTPAPTTPPPPEPTTETTPTATPSQGGIWISAAELAARPTSGSAWTALSKAASQSCATPNLANQDDPANVCVMAKALVFARSGNTALRADVVRAIKSVADSGTFSGRALALGRELAAYVIAADLISLKTVDPTLDTKFRTKIKSLLTTPTSDGPANLVKCHEERPNNWGTHCGASRVAVAAYLGDTQELERAARVFRGWLGDRASYAGFKYGDTSWQCSASAPVGINPKGCTRNGRSLDGVLADDQRRAGSFTWPPPKENYVYEALQGALVQAVILQRQGYPAFEWGDRALLRAFKWLHDVAGYGAEGDDTWQPHLVNRVYGTSFPAPTPAKPGKNVGWTDWTHGK